jgi:uncharacterized membrane protein YeiH
MHTSVVDYESLFRLVHFFDILAAVVFAVSGALVASRKGLDVMAFMWLAVITGVGGGTVRDLILNVPVFWVQNPVYISACLVTAVLMHFVAPLVESRYKTLLWFDAFGLALVTVAGTVRASDVEAPALVAIAMGAVTGIVGGILAIRWATYRRFCSLMRSTSRRQCSVLAHMLDSTDWALVVWRR